jgi:periplasmic divalent cation tolerance protein
MARSAVTAKLAACAHISAPVQSLYHWNDQLENNYEVKITFKTIDATRAELVAAIIAAHPYETPEVLWWPAGASSRYAAWVAANATGQVTA